MTHQHNKKNRWNGLWKWITGLASVAVIVYGINYFYQFDTAGYSDDAQIQQLLSPVNARVGGYVQEVNFKEFQQVKKGDTLIIIDNTDYLVQAQLAEANLLDAQAGKNVTHSSVNTAENAAGTASANIEETKARLWNAKKNLDRYEILLNQESVTEQQYDQVKSEYDALQAKLQALQSTANGNRLSVRETGAKLGVNDAAVKRAQAQLEAARLNIQYTVITAPCNGYMGRKNITAGQLVQPGQQLAAVINNDDIWLTVNIKEKQLASLRVGQQARVHIDALPDHDLTATITAVAGATGSTFSLVPTDNATGNFVKVQQRVPLRLDFKAAQDSAAILQLKAGMNAVVYFK